MHTKNLKAEFVAVAMLCSLVCFMPGSLWAQSGSQTAAAMANEPIINLTQTKTRVELIETFTKVIQLEKRIRSVDGFDADVLQVNAISPNQIRLQAIAPGVTQLILIDEAGTAFSIDVYIEGDVRHLQATIKNLFPQSSVKAVKVGDSVILRGYVSEPGEISNIVDVAQEFSPKVINQMDFGAESQIQLKIKVMEVQRSKLRRFGFNFFFVNNNGYLASTPGQLVPLAGITASPGGVPSLTGQSSGFADSTLSFGIIRPNSMFNGFLEALKRESLLKIYSDTALVASNGRPANILAGGEFPILVPQSLGTVSIEYRPFGTSLEAVPILLGNGRLRLELQPEVSETDFANAVTLSGTTVPAITTRRVNTQVEMGFGQTLVIAGLIAQKDKGETHKVPFLGELPVIGAAFSRKQYEEGESEVIIMVTPELVEPLNSQEVPPGGPGRSTVAPIDREFILDGLLEVPNYGDPCTGSANCNNCDNGCRQCRPGQYSGSVSTPQAPSRIYHSQEAPTVIPEPNQAIPSAPPVPTIPSAKIKQEMLGPNLGQNSSKTTPKNKIVQTTNSSPTQPGWRKTQGGALIQPQSGMIGPDQNQPSNKKTKKSLSGLIKPQ